MKSEIGAVMHTDATTEEEILDEILDASVLFILPRDWIKSYTFGMHDCGEGTHIHISYGMFDGDEFTGPMSSEDRVFIWRSILPALYGVCDITEKDLFKQDYPTIIINPEHNYVTVN